MPNGYSDATLSWRRRTNLKSHTMMPEEGTRHHAVTGEKAERVVGRVVEECVETHCKRNDDRRSLTHHVNL